MGTKKSIFSRVATEVVTNLNIAAVDRDSEWQRVNTYIADCLKETSMLHSKIARLQMDFVGHELTELEEIAESILSIESTISQFAKAFYEGKLQMAESSVSYGGEPGEHPENPARAEMKPPEHPEHPSPDSYDIPIDEDEAAFEIPPEEEEETPKKKKSEEDEEAA